MRVSAIMSRRMDGEKVVGKVGQQRLGLVELEMDETRSEKRKRRGGGRVRVCGPKGLCPDRLLMRKCVDGRLNHSYSGWNSDPGAIRLIAAE